MEENKTINQTQIVCASCNSAKIQLLLVTSTKTHSFLDLLCMQCGLLMNYQTGGGNKPVPKAKKFDTNYTG